MEFSEYDFTIPHLGERTVKSPLSLSNQKGDRLVDYTPDAPCLAYNRVFEAGQTCTFKAASLLELAGPRELIFFEPRSVRAAIVTCGGLCPGINDCIRAIVMTLWYHYGVQRIIGFRFGYKGIFEPEVKPMVLNPSIVEDIHRTGGSLLGTSRGCGTRTEEILKGLMAEKIDILFCIGGDGTLKGASALSEKARHDGYPLSVVGIPKTIDNDIAFIDKSFGFETAVEQAVMAVKTAHTEAHDIRGGVGLVKVMGRHSGFIAAYTALSMNDVNFVIIPEVPIHLHGPQGLLSYLKDRLKHRNHAVILVAEGSGQAWFAQKDLTKDASGNEKFNDVGMYLKEMISNFFHTEGIEGSVKYIDPGYLLRGAGTNAGDALYCTRLGNHAVHAAMAGKTGVLIGLMHNEYVHVPIALSVSERKTIAPESNLWRDVIECTGQSTKMQIQ